MVADYAFCVKSIATYAPAFLGYNNSVLAVVVLMLKTESTQAYKKYDMHIRGIKKKLEVG